MAYYQGSHADLIDKLVGPMAGFSGFSIDQGLGGAMPGDPPPFMAIGYLDFESMEALQQAMGTHAPVLMGDTPNYTNVQPHVLISQVVK